MLLDACAPYYVQHQRFFAEVRNEQYASAEAIIASNRKAKKKRNRVLYLLERGHVSFLKNEYAQSAAYFAEADLLTETYKKQIGTEILAYITNPNIRPYRAESFELVMMHYYNAMNFVMQGNYESARVEVRRMNLLLEGMDDTKRADRKYSNDAFGHLLMGMIYEISGDVNNAFIAYRNAEEAYQTTYSELFSLKMPDRLPYDLVRTSRMLGFKNEQLEFAKKYQLSPDTGSKQGGAPELMLLVETGWGAYKEEWSIDFTFSKVNDQLLFANPGLGLNFYFPASSVSSSEINALNALRVFRIAFPRYVEPPAFYKTIVVEHAGKSYTPEEVQPLSKIARQSLQDRFMKEMSEALLRFALKKAAEYSLRKENSDAGAILGLANAFSEQADTRNWQTLPRDISLCRFPLNEGQNTVVIRTQSISNQSRLDTLLVEAKPGKKYLRTIRLIRASRF